MDEGEKCCADCKTKTTPLWRNGPFGPKSLCNACGIRYRKKSTMVSLNRKAKKKVESSTAAAGGGGNRRNKSSDLDEEDLSARVMALGKEVVLLQKKKKKKRRSKIKNKHKRKLGEVEQAAFLLMALSCGSVFD